MSRKHFCFALYRTKQNYHMLKHNLCWTQPSFCDYIYLATFNYCDCFGYSIVVLLGYKQGGKRDIDTTKLLLPWAGLRV